MLLMFVPSRISLYRLGRRFRRGSFVNRSSRLYERFRTLRWGSAERTSNMGSVSSAIEDSSSSLSMGSEERMLMASVVVNDLSCEVTEHLHKV